MVEKEFYSSRKSVVDTLVELQQKNGQWKVSLKMTQGRKNEEDKDWETRNTEVTLFGNDIDKVMAQAAVTLNQYLESLNWDLFMLPAEEKKVLND